jgi:ElaB/YqjD/DUF883 family membrane-anchored ribosome-binding protein
MPQTQRARERLLLDLRSLARDAEHLLEATADDVSDKAADARKHLAETVERAKALGKDWRERGLTAAKTTAVQADEVVRANPYRSVGVAFGLGLLIGLLVPRK